MIKRRLLQEFRGHLGKREISMLIGPRQVGKTTLMLLLKNELDKSGERTVFLNLDREADKQFFFSQDTLLKKIELETGGKKSYIFIDEIQRKENAGIFLKGIYDMNLPYKFIVSGSGSMELKEKIHESLTGRKRLFELNPVSFEEFVNFRTDYRYEKRLDDFFSIEKSKIDTLLDEYLQFGGYPKLVQEKSFEEKRKIIDEIYRSYLDKDIVSLLHIERRDAFTSLVRILASQTGQMVNYSEIASLIGLSVPTLKNYLWYGEKTFVIYMVTPYFTNVRKEITKSPAVYFYDLGLRNYALGSFGNLDNPKEKGSLFQNFIFNIMRDKLRYSNASIHFWRTKDKAEVDLVLNLGREIVPVEIKYRRFSELEMTRSLRSFIEKYKPRDALIISLGHGTKVKFGTTTVTLLPFWKLFNGKVISPEFRNSVE